MKNAKHIRLFVVSLSIIFLASGFFPLNGWGTQPEENVRQSNKDETVPTYKEGELIVKFKPGVPESKKEQVHSKIGSKKVKGFSHLGIDVVKLPKGMAPPQAIEKYNADPAVAYSEPNYQLAILDAPNDPLFNQLWGLYNTGQNGGTPGADIDALDGWTFTTGSDDVVVAVIDTGVDYTHQDLMLNIWSNPLEIPGNGIDDDGDGYVDDVHGINAITGTGDPFDDCGHGTHVSGTIGASGNNSIGVTGVNWHIRIMPCKFLDANGYGYDDGAIECLEYVRTMKAKGVNIIATSNSWGGTGYSQALNDAISAQQDILFIAAAGNSSHDNDQYGFYPADYFLPNVIAVAATDNNDSRAYFSNYGRHSVSVGAPGVNVMSTLPATNLWRIAGGYGNLSGTSMATPHVSGIAALIKSQDMTRDWKAIRNLILSGGEDVTSLAGMTITGKRANAFGSLTCIDSPVFSALEFPDYSFVGVPTVLSALSIDCANPVGPVTVTSSAGETIVLHDDGASPDIASGDGIFSAAWTPAAAFSDLTFSSAAGAEKVVLSVVNVPPTPSGIFSISETTWRAALQDTSAGGSSPVASVTVSWGDGVVATQAPGTTFSHTYFKAGLYSLMQTAKDTAGRTGSKTYTVTVSNPQITGHVYKKDGTTPVGGAYVWVTRTTASGSKNTYLAGTKADGSFSFSNLGPGNYTQLKATKSGYTFPAPTDAINTTGGDNVIKAINP